MQATRTPLCLASSNGHWEVAELLIGAGVNVDQKDEASVKLPLPVQKRSITLYGVHELKAVEVGAAGAA